MLDVLLKIGADRHRGWTDVKVMRSSYELADSFQIGLSQLPGAQAVPAVKPGDACELWVDDLLLVTGFVDRRVVNYEMKVHQVMISGRSKAGDLVDCLHPGLTFNRQSLAQIIRRLASDFGIDVAVDAAVARRSAEPFETAKIAEGESYHEFFQRLASYRAVLVTSTATGDLLLSGAPSDYVDAHLSPDNVLKAAGEFDHSARFYSYLVRSQTDDTNLFSDDILVQGYSIDDSIRPSRSTLIQSDQAIDQAGCERLAQWYRNTAIGQSSSIRYIVQGWYAKPGILWAPRQLVRVSDPLMGIDDTRVISGVLFLLDDDGVRAELSVTHPAGFDLVALPQPEPDDDGALF